MYEKDTQHDMFGYAHMVLPVLECPSVRSTPSDVADQSLVLQAASSAVQSDQLWFSGSARDVSRRA